MSEVEFRRAVTGVREWFNVLNPYRGAGHLLKLEDANFELRDGKLTDRLAPLFSFAISAKRYALFEIPGSLKPVLRKASAHGLGHLIAPYDVNEGPAAIPAAVIPLKEIGVERWQHDVWYRIVEAALGDNPNQVPLSDLPQFDNVAASRYAATTPALLAWFDRHNDGRVYRDQVRPFNFLTAFQPRRRPASDWDVIAGTSRRSERPRQDDGLLHPVAPFHVDPCRAVQDCFDRHTGEAVHPDHLKSYAEVLARYHLHPEDKFRNGEFLDRGPTMRRHVHVAEVRYIGKEANRWEEQFYLGYDPETQIEYDMGEGGIEQLRIRISEGAAAFGHRQLAAGAGIAREALRAILKGEAKPMPKTAAKLLRAITGLSAQVHGEPTIEPFSDQEADRETE